VASRGGSACVSALETHLGYWLRIVSNHVSHAFKTKVEAHDVTVAEWVVLRQLFDATGIQPSQLADEIGLTKGAVSKLVDRLVAKRLVLCRANPRDGRARVLSLSASGRKLVPTLAALADQNDAEVFGRLSRRQRAALRTTLMVLVQQRDLKGAPID